ncbi:MAG: lipid A biosynthesis acyltransferase [Bacteroidetes bacterium]|nr:MAG: lipid A biosynthesis acyltransferase [Bacteroidota bacterium]
MKLLGYILTYAVIWLLHLLPGRLLYLFSDFLYLLICFVVRYRRSVVLDNLAQAFPGYTRNQVRQTARKFYRHLADLILESSVAHFYSRRRVMKHIRYRNPELLDHLYGTINQVIGVTAHYGNWEYLSTLGLVTKYPVIGVYKKLKNPYFDRLIRKNREKHRAVTVPMEQVARKLIAMNREGSPAVSLFLSDQRPIWEHIQYWTAFLGRPTPLFLGTEKLARKLDAAVVFIKIYKVMRGRYEVEFELITTDPATLEPFAITESHVRILERMIRDEPAYWLWSHRRWKHSYERFLREHPERPVHGLPGTSSAPTAG